MAGRIILKGGTVYRKGVAEKCDLVIENGTIVAFEADAVPVQGDRVADVGGLCVTEGLADVHVHLREPGFSYKETIVTGTHAAAHGGYTVVCAMPNLNPVPDTLAHLEEQMELIRREAFIRVLPYAAITENRAGGKVVDMAALKPYVVGFSDDGSGVQSEAVMREAMQKAADCDVLIAAHCEVNALLEGGCIHDGDFARRNKFKGISSASEWREVERDIRLARETGCRLHVCHISTKESVELIRKAKAEGVKVTCETAPHYLALCDEDLCNEGRFKMNPPIRSREDMYALLDGVVDGTIDMIATDHAPHSAAEKAKGLIGSAMGIVGLETAFPVIYTRLVKEGIISFERMLELMSYNPRRIFSLGGELAVGQPADLAVFDLEAKYNIDSTKFLSMGHSSPFHGWRVQGKTIMTMKDGKIVYENEDFKMQ